MVDVLVILDGASEPLRDGAPTSLELARTPALDRLAREGELTRLRTVAPGLAPGSEAAIPALLGWTPTSPVDRGAVEAAAYGIEVPEGEHAWRVDVVGRTDDGDRAWRVDVVGGSDLAQAIEELRAAACDHALHRLRGHRLLLVGASPPSLVGASSPSLVGASSPSLVGASSPGLGAASSPSLGAGLDVRVWPEGVVPPCILGPDTVLVGARGAAVGIARLMGAATIVPAGATGLPASDLAAKATAALRAIDDGAARVVVHVGGPDEAAHARDATAKVASIERADRRLVGPLAAAVRDTGGTLTVCPDHGCDPRTGVHDALAVPCVTWSPAALWRELERALAPRRRLTERAVARLPEVAVPTPVRAAA